MKKGGVHYLKLNRAQQEYSRKCSKRNIVLKARQLGITTYIAARFFIQTITQPGTLTVQVAHSAGIRARRFSILCIAFGRTCPNADAARGADYSRARTSARLCFPRLDSEYRVETADDNAGRGMTIHNLHCSEVSRWPRGAEETLASLRAAVVRRWRDCAGVDAERGGGNFLRGVGDGGGDGIHDDTFFPGGMRRVPIKEDVAKKPVGELTDEEKEADGARRIDARRRLRGGG